MIGMIFNKIKDNYYADHLFLSNSYLSIPEKLKYILTKYISILLDKEQIEYLGKNFVYDNRFTPLLLEFYPSEIEFIGSHTDIDSFKNILDVGANIGQWSYTFKSIYSNVNIFSFEPNKKIFKFLEQNSSQFNNWTIFPLGLSTSENSKYLYYPKNASAAGSLNKKIVGQDYSESRVRKTKVETINLSKKHQVLKVPKKYDLVKIDVEGHEIEVLKSLKNIKFKYLYIEIPVKSKRDVNVKKISNTIKNYLKMNCRLLGIHKVSDHSLAADALFEIIN